MPLPKKKSGTSVMKKTAALPKTAVKRKKPAASAKAKPISAAKTKMTSKPALKAAKKQKPLSAPATHGNHHGHAPDGQRGFMWRLLEQKRAAQKQKALESAGPRGKVTSFERFRAQNSGGFSRFAGPRRKAG